MSKLFPRWCHPVCAALLLPCSAVHAAGPVYSSPATISLVAGIPRGSTDGPGDIARFSHPTATAVDSTGSVFVVDFENATIRKITPDRTVSTFAGRAGEHDLVDGTGTNSRFSMLRSITIDAADNLYVLDFGQIRKITPAGVVSTLPGVALGHFSGTSTLAIDAQGTIYVADQQKHTIHRYSGGTLTLVAGGGIGYVDDTGANARFNGPAGIAADTAGNLYVADQHNSVIRKITPSGVVTTLAGSAANPGQADGAGATAGFWYPQGVAVDAAGTVFVTDWGNSTIRRITPAGNVTTLAGKTAIQGSADGTGDAARFNQPVSLSVSRAGDLYVADTRNNSIRKITPAGQVTTYAGSSSTGSNDGGALHARFQYPSAVATDRSGNLYVADRLNNTIRKIVDLKSVFTLAGMPDQGSGYSAGRGIDARFWWPSGLVVDDAGNVYVTDTMNNVVRKIAPDGTVSLVAGTPYPTPAGYVSVGEQNPGGSVDGPGAQAQFYGPWGIALDGSGNLYVADQWNHTIRKITPAGEVTTVAGQARTPGTQDGQGSGARFNLPTGITSNAQGTLYVADQLNHTIRMITPQGQVTTFAGSAGKRGSLDGSAAEARFNNPTGVALDPAGNLFVADYGNNTIRMITPAGLVSTVAGYPGLNGAGHGEFNSYGFRDGTGQTARFDYPSGIAVSSADTLFIADMDNNAIRRASLASAAPSITSHPQNQTVAAGGPVQFSVVAAEMPELSYQWYFNGLALQGATSASLNIANVRSSDGGEYTVTVSNARGSVTSNKAVLTVTSVSAPSSPSTGSGSNGGGGGGGAPSGWFIAVLGSLAAFRSLQICFRRTP